MKHIIRKSMPNHLKITNFSLILNIIHFIYALTIKYNINIDISIQFYIMNKLIIL